MIRVDKPKNQTNCQAICVAVLNLRYGAVDGCILYRDMNCPFMEDMFGHFLSPLPGHQWRGMVLLKAEHVRPGLPSDFQQIAKSFCDQ